MRIAMGCAGLFFGAIVGGNVGICVGLLWGPLFHQTSFEGFSVFAAFFSFMPILTIVGAIAGSPLSWPPWRSRRSCWSKELMRCRRRRNAARYYPQISEYGFRAREALLASRNDDCGPQRCAGSPAI